MIRNIIFDMGEVLIRFDPDLWMTEQSADDRTLLYRAVYGSPDWLALDRGEITEEELISRAEDRVPPRLRDEIPRLVRWYDPLIPVEGMEALAAELRAAGYRIYLLSNTSKAFHRFRAHIPALRHFDGEFISADVGLLKPDARIFEAFLARFGLRADECLFIDDYPPNIQSAKNAGLGGIVFTGDAQALWNELSAAGIL